MLKMSIITKNNFAVLGINGVDSFFESVGSPLDAIQTVDHGFLEKVGQMKTFDFGFTEEIKQKFHALLSKSKGEKILLSDAWLISYEDEEAKNLMKFVELINNGHSIAEALKEFNAIAVKEKISE